MYAIIYINESEHRHRMMSLLFAYHADVNVQNERKQTALMQACILNQADTVDMLMKQVSIITLSFFLLKTPNWKWS